MFNEYADNNSAIRPYDEDSAPQNVSIYGGLSWIKFPQSGKGGSVFTNRMNAKRDPIDDAKWLTVSESARTRARQLVEDVIIVELKEAGESIEQFEFLHLKFIPVAVYFEETKRVGSDKKTRSVKVGGRGMWKFSPQTNLQINGADAAVVCMSTDGIAPQVNYVGTNPPFRNEVNAPWHTGLQRNVPITGDCETCPFADFAAYGGKKPQCGEQLKFLAYLPVQQDMHGAIMTARIAVIGGSFSQQRALGGAKAGDTKIGHATRALPDFAKLIEPTNSIVKEVAVADFDYDECLQVVGFAFGDDKMEHFKGINYVEIQQGSVSNQEELEAKAAEIIAEGKLPEITHIAYAEQKYAWAPEGLKGDIYPFEFLNVINANEAYPQRIPLTTIKDDDGKPVFEPLTPKEKADFLEVFRPQAKELRQLWKEQRAENAKAVQKKLASMSAAPLEISSGPAPEMLVESIPED